MSLRALRTLAAIAQHGSFARAAEAVCLTQSAVSLHVRTLEEAFNAPLFDRSRRTPTLTEAGRRAVERARDSGHLRWHCRRVGRGRRTGRRLRIGAIQTALAGVLPAALAALRRQHPRLRVQVYSGMSAELASRLDAGELDAAVTTEPVRPHPPGRSARPCIRMVLGDCPPGLHAQDAHALQQHPFIRFDRRSWAGRVIDSELRRQRWQVHTEMELDSQDAIVQMVACGLGVAVAPLSREVRARLDGLGLTCLPFAEPQRLRRVVLLEQVEQPAARLSAALAEAIRQQAGDEGHP